MKCIFLSYVHSACTKLKPQNVRGWTRRKWKPRENERMVKYCMLGTRAVRTPSVLESLPIYSDGRIVCPYELRLTVAELSGWRSPPRQPPSMRTQTGPGQRGEGGVAGLGNKTQQSDGSLALKSSKRTRSRQWRYLGANQAWSLVPDVLKSGSDVDLLHTWKRVNKTNSWASCRFQWNNVIEDFRTLIWGPQ